MLPEVIESIGFVNKKGQYQWQYCAIALCLIGLMSMIMPARFKTTRL
jgi:hypothetical protein